MQDPNEPESREIGGYTYEIRQLPAVSAWPVFLRVKDVLGAALVGGGDVKLDEELTVANMVSGIVAGFGALTPDDLQTVVLPLLGKVTVDGKQLTRDLFQTHFMGRYGSLFRLLAACVEINFADFFVELRVELGNLALTAGLKRAAVEARAASDAGGEAA